MAECGIYKYDSLPARVGYIDVDYLRWRLYKCDNPSKVSKIPILGYILTPNSDFKVRMQVIALLERASKEAQ